MRDDLKRYMDSLMNKSGKLRSLIRELREKYAGDAAATQFLCLKNVTTGQMKL